MKCTAILFGLGLFALAGAARAQQLEPEPLPAEQPALVVLKEIAEARTDAARLAVLDRALRLLPQPTMLRGSVLCERASTLQRMDRPVDAREGFEQCRQLRPDDPNVWLAIAFDESQHNRPVEAATLIIRAAAVHAPALANIDADTMATVMRQLHYSAQDALADRLTDALVDAGYARSNPDAFSDYARSAIEHHLRDHDTAGALRLLPSIVAPDAGIAMLIDRQFAPIWPQIEQWAGDDLSEQRRALLAGARATFETTGTPAARLDYAAALAVTGHRGDAIDLLDQWLTTDVDTADRWSRSKAVVRHGRMLAEEGQRAEGIKRMRAAIDAPPVPDSAVENIVPNLVLEMLLAHDYAGASDVLDHHTPPPAKLDSPAAVGYFIALRACALEGLGKHKQAVEQSYRLQTVYPTADAAQRYAIACVASPDAQAQAWIARTRATGQRSGALVALATARYRARKGLPVLTIEEGMLRRIEARPDVRATFDALARALPETYEPALDKFNAAPPPVRRTASSTPVA